jgi:NADH:ubiquinone reductase (H+-translocating)
MTNKKNILIVGGGFAGVKAALELSKYPDLFTITLVSDQPDFRYYPTLYHTATGGTSQQSNLPLTNLFKDKAVHIVIDEVTSVDRKKKRIGTKDNDQFNYDVLIMALGSVTNYFGIPGMAEHSYSIKSVEEAKRFKAHLHRQFETGKADTSYVIIGGGPTGIELAGALPGYLHRISEAHAIDPETITVEVIEMAPNLLPRLPKRVGETIAKRLTKLGVKLHLGKKVEGVDASKLLVDGQPLQSKTVVWTSGVANHPLFADAGFELTDRHKVKIDEYLQASEDVYVLGDNADTMYSGMAQTALYDAKFVASHLVAAAHNQTLEPYVPKAPITVIPVGPGWASVLWGRVQLYGLAGWVLRLAADARGFSDYEPWWQAGEQLLTEFVTEEECEQCAKA